jgi:hypothetical protein
MNEKINSIIESYLNSQHTDYALLINGEWGCGKTYYIEGDLKKLCANKEFKYIYISLNGCDSFIRITNKITYRLLPKNGKINIDDDLIDNILSLGSELSNLHSSIKMGYSILNNVKAIITKPVTDRLLLNINPNKTVIIFDDLERISDNIIRNDTIGLVYENYTKKGYKTIFVGDETNIKDDKYDVIKEKVIRRTVSYEPNRKVQLDSFIRYKNYDGKTKIYLEKNKEKIINYFIELQILNLRTVSFVLDNFTIVFEKINVDMREKFGDFLFKNILILTNENKIGNITIENLRDRRNLDNLSSIYYIDAIRQHNGEKPERTYLNDFHDKYLKNPNFSDFRFVKEIFSFILTGYFDVNKLVNELKSLFHDEFIDDSEKTYRLLIQHWGELEEDEIKMEIYNLVKYLEEGKYHASKLPYLYTFLKSVQINNFLCDWNYDIEKVINTSLSVLSQKPDMIPDNAELLEHHNKFDENEPNDLFYNYLVEEIKKLSTQKKIPREKNKMEKTFQAILSNDGSYSDLLYSNHTFLQEIIKTKSENYFLSLNNKGIGIFQSYIYNRFFQFGNAGLTSYDEKPALEKIINYIEQNINNPSYNLNHYRVVRLKQLITDMKRAVEHLEKTHNNNSHP